MSDVVMEKNTWARNMVSDDKWKMTLCCYIIGSIHLVILTAMIVLHVRPLIVFNIMSISLYILIAVKIIKKNKVKLCAVAILIEIALHSTLCMLTLGWHSGFQLYLIPALEIFSYMIYREDRQKNALIATGMCAIFLAIVYCMCYAIGNDVVPIYISESIRGRAVNIMYVSNAMIAFTGTCAYITFFAVENYYYRTEMEKRIETLDNMSSEDAVTGLYNRKSMDMFFKNMINKNIPFFVMTCNIDDMGSVGDATDVDKSNYLLREIADIIKENLRGDYVSRWGTQEYLVAVVTDSSMHMSGIAERIRKIVEDREFVYNMQSMHTTITAGISEYVYGDDGEKALKNCINSAETKMYSGIRHQKNTIVM